MPPPQFALHLFQGPHEDQKIGNGHGLFSLQNLNANKNGKENGRRHSQCSMPSQAQGKVGKLFLSSIYTIKKLILVRVQTQQHKKI